MTGPAELTAEFWAAAAEDRLVRPVCTACGRSFFTPRVVCPHCRSTAWRYEDSVGTGTVSSHTTVYRGPDETWDTPYVLGVVDVDEGWDLLTRLLVEAPDEAEPGALIGTRVRVRFVPAHPPDTRRLPAFEPVEATPRAGSTADTADTEDTEDTEEPS
ncbi:MAG: Zn-ribbon domain-containing OB-fold protein [Microthrixaceae bacterium]